jgi:hypothetical protein
MLEKRRLDHWSIKDILREARTADRREFEALNGRPWRSVEDSLWAAAKGPQCVSTSLWTPDDRLVAVGGFSMAGLCWFLCTDRVEDHKKDFCREILANRDTVHSFGAVCHNVVGLNNELHVRFLKWLGAEFGTKVTQRRGWEFAHFFIPPPIGG